MTESVRGAVRRSLYGGTCKKLLARSAYLACGRCKKATPPAPAATTPAPPPAASGQPIPGQSPAGQAVPGQPAAVKPMPAQIPAVVARVNGEAIERWEFDNAVKRVEARAGGPVPPDKRDEVLRNVLDQLVAYHLLAQESRARKMDVPDSEVDARVAEIRKSFPDEKAFQQGIAAQGLTVDQVRAQTRTNLRGVEDHRRRSRVEDRRAGRGNQRVLPAEPRAVQAGRDASTPAIS